MNRSHNTTPTNPLTEQMTTVIGLETLQIHLLFPFHIVFDSAQTLLQMGDSLAKLFPTLKVGDRLTDTIRVITPIGASLTVEGIRSHTHTVFFIEFTRIDDSPVVLKGQMIEQRKNNHTQLFFLGSPVIRRLEDAKTLGLKLSDFAIHDSPLDQLILLEAKERTIQDQRALTSRLSAEIKTRRETEQALLDSQDRLKRAQEVAALGHWQWDLEEDYIYWSDEILAILGLDTVTPITHVNDFLERVIEADRPAVQGAMAAVRLHQGTDRFEFRLRRPDGEVREVWGQSAICSLDGKPVAHGIIQDITVSKRVEHQLRQRSCELEALKQALETTVKTRTRDLQRANEQLELLNQKKSQFVSIVSHELRSPLTSIKAFTELVRDDIEDHEYDAEKHSHYLKIVNEETDRLTRLINDLLDLQRIDANKMVWRDHEIDLYQIARSVADRFTRPFANKGLTIEVKEPAQRMSLLGDLDRFTQVFTNLLTNALHHLEQGGVTVSLEEVGLTGLALYVSNSTEGTLQLDALLLDLGFDLLTTSDCPQHRRSCPMVTAALDKSEAAIFILHDATDQAPIEALLTRLNELTAPPKLYLIGDNDHHGLGTPFADRVEMINPNDYCPPANCPIMAQKGLYLRQHLERGQLLVSVSDTGPGIAEPEMQRIFERFHQVTTLTSNRHGSGLGLAICREIIDHYHGRIWCESKLGYGSRFRFIVPKRFFSQKPLGTILRDSGAITEGQLQQALRHQRYQSLSPLPDYAPPTDEEP